MLEQRFHANCRVAAELILEGQHVYAPIVHGHPLTQYGVPGNGIFWKADDELVVLRLPGWDQSRGVGEVVALAQYAGTPVRYLVPDDPWTPTLAHVATEAQS